MLKTCSSNDSIHGNFGASSFMFVDNAAAKSYKSGKNHFHQVQAKNQKLI